MKLVIEEIEAHVFNCAICSKYKDGKIGPGGVLETKRELESCEEGTRLYQKHVEEIRTLEPGRLYIREGANFLKVDKSD